MKSIKNFKNENVTSSIETVKGGRPYRTVNCIGPSDRRTKRGLVTNTHDWNPFNNDGAVRWSSRRGYRFKSSVILTRSFKLSI
ncbi:MAG: hypothetical protein P8I82_00450 [Flavobacteriales bacterium]|nr:hypothetical protein [Flavobacteriales bacterium]